MANLIQPLESTGAAVEPMPTPYSNLRPPKSGGEVAGEALQQAGRLVGEVGVARMEEMNAAQIAQGEAKMITTWRTMFDDPESGFKTQRGLAARQALPVYTQQLQKTVDDAVATGSTPAAQRALQMRGALVLKDWERVAGGHAIQEEERYKDQAFKGRVEAGLTDVSNSWADLSQVTSKLQRMRPYVQAEAQRQGDPDDEAGRWTKVQQEAAKGVLAQLVAHRDVEGAKTYLGQVSEVLGPEATKWTHEVELLGAHVGALKDAGSIVANARVEGTPIVDENKALAAWQKLPDSDPERKEKAWELVQHQIQAGHAAQAQANGSTFQRVLSAYASGRQVDPADQAALLDPRNPGGALMWDHFKEIQQRDLNHWRTNQERQHNAPPTPEEEAAMASARNEILADDPKTWAQRTSDDVTAKWGAKVTPRQLAELHEYQTQAKKHFAENGQVLPSIVDRQLSVQLHDALNYPTDVKRYDPDQLVVYNRAATIVTQREREWFADPTHKGKPTPDDYSSWVGDALIKGQVKGTGWLHPDTVTRAEAEANPEYQGKSFVPEISQADRDRLIGFYIKERGPQGLVPTEAEIEARYRDWKRLPRAEAGAFAPQIPKVERAQIQQAFQSRFKRQPTDAEVERMFRLHHNLPAGQ